MPSSRGLPALREQGVLDEAGQPMLPVENRQRWPSGGPTGAARVGPLASQANRPLSERSRRRGTVALMPAAWWRTTLATLLAAGLVIGEGLAGCGGGARPARQITSTVAPGVTLGAGSATVTVDPAAALASFTPRLAIGGALDGQQAADVPRIYTRANEMSMASAGLGALSYRLRTELGVEAWHWNASGQFSDPRARQGYWTGSASVAAGPAASYGYSLPRRGDTIDQADNAGYSRLDDGRQATFWKSNPYLDARYTGQPDSAHPQWIMVDLGAARAVDALRIDWASPYATHFAVQWWKGPDAVNLDGSASEGWRNFSGRGWAGHPGQQTIRVAPRGLHVRYVRVLMSGSSHTGPSGPDFRARAGYAVHELAVGSLRGGRLYDLVRHRADRGQTVIYTSSTDPWHRASDRDPNYEQPSFASVLGSGLTRGQPILVPVSVLYGTPADAVSELRSLIDHGVAIRGVELGEEPDGQLITPEDYGALYAQFARAIHAALPQLALGGPSFQTSLPDWYAWPNATGETSFTRRWVAELRRQGALGLLNFFSFEWYPFDNVCTPAPGQLRQAPALLSRTIARQLADGLPPGIPRYISEYGYSSYAGQYEVSLPGALFDAEAVGQFLALGGRATFFYGYEPVPLMRELRQCRAWGNLTLLLSDQSHRIRQPVAAYWAMRLLTQRWATPATAQLTMVASRVRPANSSLVAYALRRPDGRLAVLLINPSASASIDARLLAPGLSGTYSVDQLSGVQYRWHPRAGAGFARPDGPPAHSSVSLPSRGVRLPPYSITVVSP